MTFNIGSQTGGVINNVVGDQQVTGGQQGTIAAPDAVRQAARELRDQVAATPLDATTAAEVRGHAEEIDAEVHAPKPDRSLVARSLERLTRLLTRAGSLATAGAALVSPLQALANWLGTLGEPILRLMPGQ